MKIIALVAFALAGIAAASPVAEAELVKRESPVRVIFS
jgi:hypothetical protein